MLHKFNSIIFIGFLIVSLLLFTFSLTSSNKVSAIEYTTYTRENLGIEFQYPSVIKIKGILLKSSLNITT